MIRRRRRIIPIIAVFLNKDVNKLEELLSIEDSQNSNDKKLRCPT